MGFKDILFDRYDERQNVNADLSFRLLSGRTMSKRDQNTLCYDAAQGYGD